jgi:hypothetical protein
MSPVDELLPQELTGQFAGKTKVKDVRVDVREDSSERPAVFITLILSDPPKAAETWPVEDLWALRRMVREAKDRAEATWRSENKSDPPELPWFVEFQTTREEVLDWEDIDESLDPDD